MCGHFDREYTNGRCSACYQRARRAALGIGDDINRVDPAECYRNAVTVEARLRFRKILELAA